MKTWPEGACHDRTAHIQFNNPSLDGLAGAQVMDRVRATRIFANCPRPYRRLRPLQFSPDVPRARGTLT